MLSITGKQFVSLRNQCEAQFEQALKAHAVKFAAKLCSVAGEESVIDLVRFSISDARQYDWSSRELVRFHLELSLTFGFGFVDDPQYRWVGELMRDPLCSAPLKAQMIYKETARYLDVVLGPKGEFVGHAFNRFKSLASLDCKFAVPSEYSDAIQLAEIIYPEKLLYLGTEAVSAVMRSAQRAANFCGFDRERGATLIFFAMLLFGAGVLTDPMYPWFNRVVRDEKIVNQEARLNRLERKLLRYVTVAASNVIV
jgi:hypothetical protein